LTSDQPQFSEPRQASEAAPGRITPPLDKISPADVYVYGPPAAPAKDRTPAHRPKTARWLLVGAGALAVAFLLLACLAITGSLLLSRLASGNQAVLGGPEVSKAPGHETAVPGGSAASLLVARCEGDGCLVIKNQGRSAVPMSSLNIMGEKGSLRGTEWGVEMLSPGNCVKVVKNEEWFLKLPKDITCGKISGHTLTWDEKDVFWKGSIQVELDGEPVGECRKGRTPCEVKFSLD